MSCFQVDCPPPLPNALLMFLDIIVWLCHCVLSCVLWERFWTQSSIPYLQGNPENLAQGRAPLLQYSVHMKPVLCRVLDKSVKGPSRCGSMETRVDAPPPPPVLWVAVFMWGKCRELPLGNLFLVWITAISYIRNIFLKLKFKCPPQSGSL